MSIIQLSDEVRLGKGERPLIIAEIAQAHDGSLGFAHSFVDLAADAGADVVKFQTHLASQESTFDETFRVPFSYEDQTRYDYWKRMEFTEEQWAGLAKHAKDRGILFSTSCFSVEAVRMMDRFDICSWKVGSGEVSSSDLLEAMIATGRPVLLSSGMSDIDTIKGVVALFQQNNTAFGIFQCTTRYPTCFEDVGLNVVDQYNDAFDCPIGLSDHSGSIWPSVAAISRGASMVEVHLAMNKSQFGPDTSSSIDSNELAKLVEARDAIHSMLSSPVIKEKTVADLQATKSLFGKSLALRQDLPAGAIITAADLTSKKPGTGISPEEKDNIVGKKLVRDASANRLLRAEDLV